MKNTTFLKSGSHAMLAGLAQQGFAMAHFLCIIRWLAPEALGTWAMFLTLVSIVEIARLGLVQNTLVYFGTHEPHEKPRIVAASLVLSVSISVLGAFVLFLLTLILRGVWQMPALPLLMLGYIVLSVLNALLRFIDGYHMITQNLKIAAVSALMFGATNLLLTFLFKHIMGTISVFDLVVIQIVSAFLNLLFLTYHLFLNHSIPDFIKNIKGNLDTQWIKRLFNYGRYGLGTNLASMVFQRTDILLLGAFVSPMSLAVYNVATRLITYIDFPLNSLGLAFLPKLSATHLNENTEGVARLYEKSVGLLLAITIPMAAIVILGAKYIIWIVAGETYLEAVPLLQIIALLGLVKPWGRLFGVLLDAIGKPQYNFKMLLFSMLVTIFFNAVLIPFFGIQGAAWATGLSVMTTILMGQILLAKWLPVKALNAFEHILPVYRQIVSYIFTKKLSFTTSIVR
jgi:lipopolysaccharide exporter